MGRNEIVNQLMRRTGSNRDECEQFCDTLVDIVSDALLSGDRVLWKGFLSIEVSERSPRNGRNPKTNEITTFPAVKTVKCRISKFIKDMLNSK